MTTFPPFAKVTAFTGAVCSVKVTVQKPVAVCQWQLQHCTRAQHGSTAAGTRHGACWYVAYVVVGTLVLLVHMRGDAACNAGEAGHGGHGRTTQGYPQPGKPRSEGDCTDGACPPQSAQLQS